MVLLAPQASATSFIQDCQYSDYRTNQSDVVFTGEVTGIDEIMTGGPFGREAYTEISFVVLNSTKGKVNDTFTLTQPGHVSGEQMIPAMTLEWQEADVYTIQASQSEQGRQLVCGVMGRQLIKSEQEPITQPLSCRDIPSIAIHPETQERMEFNSECNVPRGWTLVTRTAEQNTSCSEQPVTAVNQHGERQHYESECDVPRGWAILSREESTPGELCAQVITHAQNPDTGDVHEYPTPCDVPEGWEVVDEPQEAEEEPTPQPSVWQRVTSWLTSWF